MLCWRTVPVHDSVIGEVAVKSEPLMRQVFITWGNTAFTSPEDEQSFLEQVYTTSRGPGAMLVRPNYTRLALYYQVKSAVSDGKL